MSADVTAPVHCGISIAVHQDSEIRHVLYHVSGQAEVIIGDDPSADVRLTFEAPGAMRRIAHDLITAADQMTKLVHDSPVAFGTARARWEIADDPQGCSTGRTASSAETAGASTAADGAT